MDYQRRRRDAQAAMARLDLNCLIVSPSADLVYLTGYDALNMERATLLVLPRVGAPFFLVPMLEAPKARSASPEIEVCAWGDTEDPWDSLRRRVGGRPQTVAVSDTMRANFVLAMQHALPEVRLHPAGPLMASLRQRKEPEEIEALREAAHRTDAVFDRVRRDALGGLTETEVADLIGKYLKAHGLAWKWNYICSVAAGEHSASPHHTLSDRTLQIGDAVCMDFGGKYRDYVSDLTRTVHIGTPPREFVEAYAVLQEAQQQAVQAVRPGVAVEEVDRVARDIITRAGYGDYFVHRTGHGLGLEVHEPPYIVAGNTELLTPGMVFSIEPGIYLPGRFGLRIEDIVIVTDRGCERLNLSPRQLYVIN
jgi:Xaa-Pro aminopeptidase